jgi:hypothetical protein
VPEFSLERGARGLDLVLGEEVWEDILEGLG